MSELIIVENEGALVVDSRLVAQELDIEHESFMETVYQYQTLTEEAFGVFRFQTGKPKGGSKGGRPPKYVLLTEDQATFLMTLSRNTPEVVQCKVNLVKAFSKAKELLKRREQVAYEGRVPYWYQRMRLALSDAEKPLPDNHFCIYLRMMDFFSQLEVRFHYIVPDISPQTGSRLVPDISIGKKFNDFLRSDDEIACMARQEFLGSSESVDFRPGGSHRHEIIAYNHVYPESSHGKNNIQECNAYPIRYASIFDYFLQDWWIPDRCVGYLKERDAEGVEYLREAINQLPSNLRDSLMKTLLGKLMRSLPANPSG
ncbi:MAG: hypothetical protein F6K23_39080 [Okeania sp. SIO2C9]|uniref:Rha family transcriptional regulator n=1 Tax=Okeania sp. SIO2C9 TaxID=2607791 RepID=UPI0013C12D95|nr:Rha family transcriptional regulator [Okeania sp. SIO2C9]NEQ78472.1 hypothetical protein [Okeania sp. SIO2C9]